MANFNILVEDEIVLLFQFD